MARRNRSDELFAEGRPAGPAGVECAEAAAPHDAEAPWLSASERRAWLSAVALMIRLPAALDAQLKRDADLTFFEYLVLSLLSEQPDLTMQMSDIASACSSSLSRLSHTASRLQKSGFLTRSRVAGPGRKTNATLTEDGYAKVVAAAPGHVRAVRALLLDPLDAPLLGALQEIGAQVMTTIEPDDAWENLVNIRIPDDEDGLSAENLAST